MQHRVEINLFGQFEVRLDGVPVRMPTRKVELVLALLAIEPGVAHSRSTLAGLIWPGQPDTQARVSLRQAIFRLKTALEPSEALEVTPGWIKLRSDRIQRDIDKLDHGAAAPALPIGTPLEGMTGYEPEIEDRLDAARAELRALLMHWLEAAQTAALASRRFTDLESLARRHLVLDGYDESALRMLMTALWRQGRRNAALDIFREVSQRIRVDLSVSVEPATSGLYQEIRAQPAVPKDQMETPVTLAEVEAPAEPAEPARDASLPHLRHIAVMHVVSGRLLAGLRNRDPEDAEAACRAASDAIERILRREGGLIAGRAGHRLSCVFGADRPDESPALSAALAAFEIARLDCAVGIDAARALVGGKTESYPAAHLAQILAEAAAPGEVRMTNAVADACRGAFVLEREKLERAEGELPAAWRLTGEVLSRGGFDIRKARGLTPFVAREAEVDGILAAAASSGPRACAITGDAGIGKSRLVHECLARLRPLHLLRVQFLPIEIGGGISRFSPVLASLLQEGGAGDPMRGLDAAISDEALRRRIAPAKCLFAAHETPSADANAPRGVRMQALSDALLLAIQVLAGRDAVLLIEDVHWADDDGALLLERMLRSLDRDGPLVIVTSRPGCAMNMSGIAGLRTMTLAPLTEAESVRLLTLLGRDDPGDIPARSGGVPLFLEEIARAGAMPAPTGLQAIPETLAGLLTRRIDSLPPHLRRTIEAAAVLGAEPADDLLLPLSGLRSDAYEIAITQLADGDLLFRIRSMPQRVYGFKHALVQEAAYQAIPTRRRAELHAQIVALREEDWRAGDRSLSAMLAHHAAEAGLTEQALDFALAAAVDAVAAGNYALARRTLNIARTCVMEMDQGAERDRLDLKTLQLRLPIHVAYAETEQIKADLKASLKLALKLRDDPLRAHLSQHAAFVYQHHDPVTAVKYADLALTLARKLSDPLLVRESFISRAQILSYQGKMRSALEAILPYADAWSDDWDERDEYLVSRYVMNQYLLARSVAALGYAQRSIAHVRQAINAAIRNNHPVDRWVAFLALGDVLASAGRWEKAAAAYGSAMQIARRHQHVYFEQFAESHLGRAELRTAAADTGRARLQALLELGDAGVHRVSRLEIEAALLCHELGSNSPLSGAEGLLGRVREVDLPAVELHILQTLVRCHPKGPQAWATAAKAILAEERYAPCDFSDAEANALAEAMA